MDKLTLEQAAIKYDLDNFNIPDSRETVNIPETTAQKWNIDAFKAGAEWQKEQCADLVKEALNKFQTAVKLLDTLVYYSHITEATGVRPANMLSQKDASKAAQQWLRDNCIMKEGEYFLINPE